MKKTIYVITAENIAHESYFNCVQLCKLTGYADPIAAIKSLRAEWTVEKDECGNIISLASN